MSQKSSRSYTQRTLKILWARAAGRCAFPECRIELIGDATDYDPIYNFGEMAHVEASSDNGPRPNPALTSQERDHYDNLILVCQNCHARIDQQPNTYPVDYLRRIKAEHEAWVRASLPERGKSATGWATFLLQGMYPIDAENALSALSPDFASGSAVSLQVDETKHTWPQIKEQLRESVATIVATDDKFDCRFAIFALAPVSACIALGFYLTSRPRTKLFQHHRDEQSWMWPTASTPPNDIVCSGIQENLTLESCEVAICFDLSATVTDTVIKQISASFLAEIHVSVHTPSTSWLHHPEQLKYLAIAARQVFEHCRNIYPNAVKWHIFYAGPAPGGIVVGQQINPTMSPPVQLYEYRHNRTPAYQPSVILAD